MLYDKYKQSRNAVWKMLKDFGIKELPIKISDICRKYSEYTGNKINLIPYSKNNIKSENSAFTRIVKNEYCIFYNDKCSVQRIRFSIAHELGHIILGHIRPGETTRINREPSANDDPLEQEANIFASRLIAPACVLHELKAFSVDKIVELCNISKQSAKFRFERLLKLEERNRYFKLTKGHGCFYINPLEIKVRDQFWEFIYLNRQVH